MSPYVPPRLADVSFAPPGILSGANGVPAEATLIYPRASTRLAARASRLNVLAGEPVEIVGRLHGSPASAAARQTVVLEARGRHSWRPLAASTTGAAGRFELRYAARSLGTTLLRVAFRGDSTAKPSTRRVGALNSFRAVEASWYGGGGTLACGGELTSSTLGVANRTLPCGTMVTLRYGSHSVRVPVIDRGPWVYSREYDLTEATKRALGFGETGEIWSTR